MEEKILQAIKELFPDFKEKDFHNNITFDLIPGWDSMNSINLQLSLELAFEMDLSEAPLGGNNTISDLILFLKEQKDNLS